MYNIFTKFVTVYMYIKKTKTSPNATLIISK